MGKRALRIAFGGALALLLASGLALASSPFAVFDIPVLAGKRIEVGGASRLSDGGAIVAGAVGSGRSGSGLHPIITRLAADGSVELAYGRGGATRPRLGAGVRVTSLAVDPSTGAAWVGVAVGPRHRSELVALDGHGRVRRDFGEKGRVLLPASGGPEALGWNANQLIVANGGGHCRGCTIVQVNATTGARRRTTTLPSAYTAGGRQCTFAAVTSIAIPSAGKALLGTVGAGRDCPGDVVALGLKPGASTDLTEPAPSRAAFVTATGRDACAADPSPHRTLVGPPAGPFARAPGGRVVAVTALGAGACAALIAPTGYPAALVVQAHTGQRLASSYAIPRRVAPLAMFRCHHHLLVIGDRHRQGVIAVVPVRAGPHALAADATEARERCAA